MAGVPDRIAIGNHDRLWRLVTNSKPVLQFVGKTAIFDHQNGTAGYTGVAGHEGLILFVGCRASRTLRAMLENHDWIFVRSFKKLLQVLLLVEFDDHRL